MTTPCSPTTWFLAQIKPNSHNIAKDNLHRQGFRTFLPLQAHSTRKQGKIVTQTRPLFPGYLFVALDGLQGRWREINSTYGIARIVSFGARPTPVPDGLVNQLMRRCDDKSRLLPPKFLQPGDQVTLSTGPFQGFMATIEQVEPSRRIWVLIEFMGGQTRVGVSNTQLCAV